jgi:hypothetical protein
LIGILPEIPSHADTNWGDATGDKDAVLCPKDKFIEFVKERNWVKQLKNGTTDELAEELFKEVDVDGDGSISKEEFKMFLTYAWEYAISEYKKLL